MTSVSRNNRARYTAWSNGQSADIVGSEAVLDALSDSILADGVESSLTKALHHGFSQDTETPTPGLDNLRDRLRAAERSAVDLAAQIDSGSLSNALAGTSRDYEFGDPFELDLGQSVLGAVKRRVGTPVKLDVSDLKVHDRETSEHATTILAVDLSRSMGERGYLLAAKKLALALTTFIRTRYPQDELLLIGFSESARQMKRQELVELQWDRYGFGTRAVSTMVVISTGAKRSGEISVPPTRGQGRDLSAPVEMTTATKSAVTCRTRCNSQPASSTPIVDDGATSCSLPTASRPPIVTQPARSSLTIRRLTKPSRAHSAGPTVRGEMVCTCVSVWCRLNNT